MNSLILVFHILTMIVSLIAMSMALAGVLLGARTAVRLAKVGYAATLAGAVAGAYLLVLHPVMHQCVVLTAYLVAVVLLYRYVFAMGNAARCHWVRG